MNNDVIDKNDPIKIFGFLTRLVNEAYSFNMSEAQAFIAPPTFLTDMAEAKFRINLSGASRHGAVTWWPEFIQYILRT